MINVSQPPKKRLCIEHKKGVGTVSLFYPVLWSWRTLVADKTIAPHRFAICTVIHGSSLAINAVLLQTLFSLLIQTAKFENRK